MTARGIKIEGVPVRSLPSKAYSTASPTLEFMHCQKPSATVSVILCTYNGATYLRQQLDSIAAQSMLPLELIACDDGSSDATVNLLESFQRTAPFRVEIVRNPTNLGSTVNFDQAIRRASGEFFALSDQDDVWLPDKLATLVPVLESDPGLGGVFSDARLLDDRATSAAQTRTETLWSMHGFNSKKQREFASRDGAIRLLLQSDVLTGATLLVRSSLRSLWQPIPRSWVHDGWLAWMLAVHARLKPVAEPLMMYRLHGEQQLGIGSRRTLKERTRTIQETERARYDRVASQFEDLLEHLQSTANDRALEDLLLGKIALLRRRAELPRQTISRVFSILGSANDYRRFARGWRSMRKDLFLA
jgi:glycosyltransferase involved in cell wall biosynthesis